MSSWKIAHISDFCITGTGGTPSRKKLERYYEGGKIPWVKSGELRETVISDTEEHITEEALKETSLKLVPAGALLLAMYGATVGRLGILGIPATTNQAICHLIPDPEVADVRYLFHLLRAQVPNIVARGVGGAQPNINQGIVKDLKVTLPSLEEQNRIADILDRVEALRAKRRASLAQLDELSQSIFTEMFGDPLKNPMGWSTINLEDVCSIITDGEHATPKRTESGIYLLSARNIQNHSLSLDDVDFIDKDEYDRISKRIIPQKGDILVSCSGTIGRVAQVKECFKFQLVRSVALLRPETSKVNPTYLEYNFDSIYLKKQIEKSVNQSSQANLFQGKIRKLKILFPPLEIQNKFAEVVGQVEKIKQSQKQSSIEINNLFEVLMQKAFTGEMVL